MTKIINIFQMLSLLCFFSVECISLYRSKRQSDLVQSLNYYEISTPLRVTRTGNLLTREIKHRVKREQMQNLENRNNRRKRYVDYWHPSNPEIYTNNEFYLMYPENHFSLVHYKISIENVEYYFDMVLNLALAAPGLIIENQIPTWNKNYTNIVYTNSEINSHDKCHFTGKVRGFSKSKVALSTCNGLHGSIDFGISGKQLFIEPLLETNEVDANSKSEFNHPHLIYNKSAIFIPSNIDNESLSQNNDWEEINHLLQKDEMAKNIKKNDTIKRKKRFYQVKSTLKTVETLVVVDHDFILYHEEEGDISNYVLTIMNMVSSLFHDVSIGHAIDIAVVRMIQLNANQTDLKIVGNVSELVLNFQDWQHKMNPTEDYHHDHAILMTRTNIYVNEYEGKKNLKGIAPIAGMCDPIRSCSIAEDFGLLLGQLIAHEMGHSFGMIDDDETPDFSKNDKFIMNPIYIKSNGLNVWSSCSKQAITNFLNFEKTHCLENLPDEVIQNYSDQFPGVLYDVNHQCRLLYGEDYALCKSNYNICEKISCGKKKDGYCYSKGSPAAQGTECGEDKWCYNEECVIKRYKPIAIDGNWSNWIERTTCSRTCGGGVRLQERYCNNPKPSNGGRYCLEDRKRFVYCNDQSCERNQPSFREIQCSKQNKIPFRNSFYRWIPSYKNDTPCQLICGIAVDQNKITATNNFDVVLDGTSCYADPGIKDLCIEGNCVKWELIQKNE